MSYFSPPSPFQTHFLWTYMKFYGKYSITVVQVYLMTHLLFTGLVYFFMDFNQICCRKSPVYALPVKQLSAKSKRWNVVFKIKLSPYLPKDGLVWHAKRSFYTVGWLFSHNTDPKQMICKNFRYANYTDIWIFNKNLKKLWPGTFSNLPLLFTIKCCT